jgi:hypothetical protein
MAIYKDFRMSERFILQFRSEFFNAFNPQTLVRPTPISAPEVLARSPA